MPPTYTVAFPNVTESFGMAMHEVLTGYFNGTTKTIGNKAITFATIQNFLFTKTFEKPGLSLLVIVTEPIRDREKYKVRNPLSSGNPDSQHAYEHRTHLRGHLVLTAPYDETSEYGNVPALRNVWSQLAAIFAADKKSFSERGIHCCQLADIALEDESKPNRLILFGGFECEARYQFTCYNN